MRFTFHFFNDTEKNGGREAVLIPRFLTVTDHGNEGKETLLLALVCYVLIAQALRSGCSDAYGIGLMPRSKG